MTTRTAAPMTARLLTGSLAPECDNVVRYDWTEFALIINDTRVVCGAMTLADAQDEARVAAKFNKGAKITLKLQTRTCTVETTFAQDLSEDGDGSLLCSEKVLAGSRWATDRGMTRNLTAEARVAVKAL